MGEGRIFGAIAAVSRGGSLGRGSGGKPEADSGAGIGALARTMRVLQCFTDDEPALTSAGSGELTGLASSTLHRLLAQLLEFGLLTRAPGHRYTIGTGLWELGELAPVSMRLRERALPHVLRLYEASGENVHIAVLSDEDPATADGAVRRAVTGPHSIPTLSRMGGRHPLHTTGVGKALLATSRTTTGSSASSVAASNARRCIRSSTSGSSATRSRSPVSAGSPPRARR